MRITSLLALAGVLSAGSAAAVVNSQALTDTETNANAAAAASAAITATATQVYSTALAETEIMFQVGEAGFVTLDTAANVLTVVSATANPGWEIVGSIKGSLEGAVDSAEGAADGSANGSVNGSTHYQFGGVAGEADVAVAFEKGDDVIEFTAGLLEDGTVETAVESNPIGVLDANGSADGEATTGTGNGGSDADDSGVLETNGTAHGEADGCTDGFITVCADADADADADVKMNDD